MKSVKEKTKTILSFALVISLCAGILAESFTGSVITVYAGNGSGGDAYICLIDDESGSEQTTHTIWKKSGATWVPQAEEIAGTSYDESTNTLTLSNFDGSNRFLETNSMGEDFKIKLVGTNSLNKIYVYGTGFGGSLDITGSGSIELNATRTVNLYDRSAICLNGESSKARLTVENTATVYAVADEGQPAIKITESLDDVGIDIKGILEDGEVLSENTQMAKTITVKSDNTDIYVSSYYQDLYKDSSGNNYGAVFSTIYSGSGENRVAIPYYRIYKLDGGNDGAQVTEALINENWEEEFGWAKIYCNPGELWFKDIPDNLEAVPDDSGRKNYTIGLAGTGKESIFNKALSDVKFIATQNNDDNGTGTGYCIFPENSTGLINSGSSFLLYYYPKNSAQVSAATANISFNAGSESKTKDVTLAKEGTGFKATAKIIEALGGVTHINSVDFYENNNKVLSKNINKDISTDLTLRFSGRGCEDESHTKTLIIKSGTRELFRKSLGRDKLTDINIDTLPVASDLKAELMITINGSQMLLGNRDNIVTKAGVKTDAVVTVESVPITFSPRVTVTSKSTGRRNSTYSTTLRPTAYEITWYKNEEGGEPLGKGASFTNTAGDMSEYLYADVKLLGAEALNYEPVRRFKVEADNKTAIDVPTISRINKLTIKLKDSTGAEIDGIPLVLEKEKNGCTSSHMGSSGIEMNYQYPAGAKVTVKISDPSYDIAEGQDDTLNCTDDEIKELVITPRKGVITSNYFIRSATVKTTDGKDVPFEIKDNLILLDRDSISKGQKLNVRLENGSLGAYYNPYMYIVKQITLEGEYISATIDDEWTYYGDVSVSLAGGTNRAQGYYYGMLYDSSGRLQGDLKLIKQIKGETSLFNIGSLPSGDYSLLIAERDAVNAVGKIYVKTLSDAKEKIAGKGADLYTEYSFSVKDKDVVSPDYKFPAGDYVDGTVNLNESRITINASPDKVSYEAIAALSDSSSKQASVRVITNQKYPDNSYTRLPEYIGDSFTINGKKVRAGAEQSGSYGGVDFGWEYEGINGSHTIYTFIINDVSKYGGFPLDIKWTVNRVQRGTLWADGYVSADKSGANNMIDNTTAHFFGRDECISPTVTCYVPDQISDSEFRVYGYAPKDSKVTLSLDGKDVKVVTAAGINGYFCETLSLNNPTGRQRHYVVARAETSEATLYSNNMAVTYCASNQTLKRIEFTDMNGNYHTAWEDGLGASGGYYYYSDVVPMKYRLSFDNATNKDDLSEVIIHVPHADDVIDIPCKFIENRNSVGIWESEEYLFGAAPPHGAWVSFKSGMSVVQITSIDTDNYKKAAKDNDDANKALVDAVGKDENDSRRKSETGAQFTEALLDVGVADVKLSDAGDLNEAVVNCQATEYFGGDFNYSIAVNSSKTSGDAASKKAELDEISYPSGVAEKFEKTDLTQVYDAGTKTLYIEPDEAMPYIAYHAGSGTDDDPFTVECVIKHTGTDGSYAYNHVKMSLRDYTQVMVDGINNEVTTLNYHYGDGKESDLLNLSESKRMYSFKGEKTETNESYMSANLSYKQNEVRAFWGMFNSNILDAAKGTDRTGSTMFAQSLKTSGSKTVKQNVLRKGFEKLGGGFKPSDDPNPCAALSKEQSKMFSSPEASYAALLMMVYNDNKGPAGSNDAALYMESNNLGINKLSLICGFLTSEDFCREMNDLLTRASLGVGAVTNGFTATGLTKTFKDKIISDFQGDALGKFLAEIGVSNHKALDKATDVIYKSLLEAERDGVKVNWDNFPFSDKYPDPRKKQEQDENSGGGGGNDGQPGENPGENPGETPGNGPSDNGGGTGPSDNGGSSSGGGTGQTGEPIPDSPTAAKDPSGYVYEAVASNRIKDVNAILYETDIEDGKKYRWNDSETGQSNPYITDKYGVYEWGVDEGAYQVTYEKAGYETYTTADHPEDGADTKKIAYNGEYYMPVPPQQVDVNVGLISTDLPVVVASGMKVVAGDGVYIVFSQYMNTSTLNNANISVINKTDGKTYTIDRSAISYPNAQADPKDENRLYANVVHISLPQLKTSDEAIINVSVGTRNYAGKALAESFSVDKKATDKIDKVSAPTGIMDGKTLVKGSKVKFDGTTKVIELSSTTEQADIFYTTDGSNPSVSNGILYTKPVSITGEMLLKAIAIKGGMENSDITDITFTSKDINDNSYVVDNKPSDDSTQNNEDVKVDTPKIKSLTKGYRSFTASWKKKSDVTEYELQYSTKKKFRNKKSKTCKPKKSTAKVTVKKLKGNKKYYVRLRAIKIVNGKKYYSGWSKVKSVKTTNVKVNTPKIKTLVKGKKSFSVTWKKAGVSAYELQYADNKNFKKKKTMNVNSKKSVVKSSVKTLKGKKKYFVRIRAVKFVKGKKYYSDWSKVKNVKTK